jgi:hypothetical protein
MTVRERKKLHSVNLTIMYSIMNCNTACVMASVRGQFWHLLIEKVGTYDKT